MIGRFAAFVRVVSLVSVVFFVRVERVDHAIRLFEARTLPRASSSFGVRVFVRYDSRVGENHVERHFNERWTEELKRGE